MRPRILAIVLLLSLPASIFSQEGAGPEKGEKRSIIVEVEGSYHWGQDDAVDKAKKRAYQDAHEKACSRAELRVRSEALVQNELLKYSIVKTEAGCALRMLDEKEAPIEWGKPVRVWIRAEVLYALLDRENRPASAEVLADNPRAPLAVKVWTEKRRYRQGEHIVIFLRGNKPFYGRVVSVSPAGKIYQLLPNEYRSDHHFEAGRTYRVPDRSQGDQFDITVGSPPFGQEQIVVYASSAPQGKIRTAPVGGGVISEFKGSREALDRGVRTIEVTPRPGALPEADFIEATWTVETSP
jgi:hypothetical protein